ncbi:MAG: DNA repair protein RecO (recombination protein O) [Marinobacter psychrophilus]|jgi:DNA repair protein RecO (recombination protein O)
MRGKVIQEPGYVIHRRSWRETSLQVDVFTLNYGRIDLIARGASTSKSPLKAQLQPFQPLLLDWVGRGDLKTLTQADVRYAPVLAQSQALFSGFYLNELLQRILPAADPYPLLFAAYLDAMAELAAAAELEPVLRRFERSLALALGYDFAWDLATDSGAPVQSGWFYGYHPQQGIIERPGADVRVKKLRGDALLALAANDYSEIEARRSAKRVMRSLVDYLLQGRPLHSRQLFIQPGAVK